MSGTGVVFIQTEDLHFAQVLSATLNKWKIAARRQEREEFHWQSFPTEEVDVVLLDIRQHAEEGMRLLRWLREHAPAIEVITLNTIDRVTASMEAMRAGAADELTVPLDAEILREKVVAACQRRRAALAGRSGKSLLRQFRQAMAASAFAQAGEFETAMDMLRRGETPEEEQP